MWSIPAPLSGPIGLEVPATPPPTACIVLVKPAALAKVGQREMERGNGVQSRMCVNHNVGSQKNEAGRGSELTVQCAATPPPHTHTPTHQHPPTPTHPLITLSRTHMIRAWTSSSTSALKSPISSTWAASSCSTHPTR